MNKRPACKINDLNVGIFAGKVHCSCCGYTMRSSKSRGEHYLQCATKHVATGACNGAFISVKKLESIVLDELNDMTRAFLDKDELEQKVEFAENLTKRKEKLQSQIDGYKKEIKSIDRGITECYKDKAKGDIDIDEYNSIVREFREDKAKYEKVVSDGESQLEEIERLILTSDNRRELIDQYTDVKELTREIVETMIDHIVVGRRIPKTKIYPVEIHWNF